MFDAARHDEKFALFQPDLPIAKIHPEAAIHNQEELVFVGVMVPNEFPLKLDELDLLAIELADDLGFPLVVKLREFVAKVDLFHGNRLEIVCRA
jgi:hypothetical protein